MFQEFGQLRGICMYLTRKGISGQIVRVLFEKFGIGIPKANLYAIVKGETEKVIRPEEVDMFSSETIEISEDEIEFLTTKLKQSGKNGTLNQ